MIVMLYPARIRDVSVGSEEAAALAELGVTYAAVLKDDKSTAVLLQGWAFDPDRSGQVAADVLAGPDRIRRILRLVAEVVPAPSSAVRHPTREEA
jgi:hypothetical protein